MGNMITVTFLTDRWTDFEKDPKKVLDQIEEVAFHQNTGANGWYGIKVMPLRHADNPGLFFTHQNSTIELSPWNKETMELVQRSPEQRAGLRSDIETARWFLDKLEVVILREERKREADDGDSETD